MKYLKMLGPATVAAMALTAFLGAGTASATGLYKYTTPSANDKLAIGTELVLSLQAGTSSLLKDTSGGANETCTGSQVALKIEKDTTGAVNPEGKASIFTFSGCSHTKTTLATGLLEFKNIAGTTNATMVSKGARFTVKSTIFGISCVTNTGSGTTLGTLTGAKGSSTGAVFDINGVVTTENGCGDSTWTGTYAVTAPPGLTVESS